MRTWFAIKNLADDTAEVRVYDEIGGYGVSAKQFCEQFNALKAAKINLRINSYGGEVHDAAAMCTAIREHPAEVTAHVDGLAASAASVVAAACDACHIGKSAFMMIHNPISLAYGNAEEMRKQADVLDKLANSIADVYCEKTKKDKDEVRKAMDDETWFDAHEAKAWGLADEIKNDDEGDPSDAAINRYMNSAAPALLKFRNVPERIKQLARASQQRPPAPATEETPMLNIVNRDGKSFVTVDGKEHEIKLTTPVPVVGTVAGKTDEEVAAAVNKAKQEGIEAERAYRTMFNTVLATAKLTGEAATEFETNFYGRAESDLKFLASHAVGQRAQAVGEGAPPAPDKVEAELAKIDDECKQRFASDRRLRQIYHCNSGDPKSADYQRGLARYIAAERKCVNDQKNPSREGMPDGDRVGKMLSNRALHA